MNRVPLPEGEAFDRLKQQVIARTGHFYYEDKEDLLWERVRKRLVSTRASDLHGYLQRLEDDDRGPEEWAALEAELTIGETYFFRYPEQFQALRETILPDILEAAAESRRLRIWSAGCATGAEAYSVAILLREVLGEQLASWHVSILGTDINDTFLAQAREARFGRWALRSLDAAQRSAWFTRDGDEWRLKSEHRAMVRFQRGNLLDLLGPAPPLELADFDLILCRNVLIYFHPTRMAEVASALVDRLQPHGWLLVGHAEPNPEFGRFAQAVSLPGTAAYRRLDGEPLPQARQTWSPQAETAAELVIPPTVWGPAAPAAPGPISPPRAPIEAEAPPPSRTGAGHGPDAAAVRDEVRQLADLGDFHAAELKCRAALDLWPEDAGLQFYAGLVAQALGRLGAAEDALRRAAYLDGGFILALYHLGLVRLARGRAEAGRKAVAAAAQLAGTLAVSERLREGAGLTAGELRELARVQLDAAARGA